jgi:hypothetical protein
MFYFCSIDSKKSQAGNREQISRLAVALGEDRPQTLANKTRNQDAGHPHFFGSFT